MAIQQVVPRRLPARRAVGVIRVSSTNGRKAAGGRFISPREQHQRIEQWCITQGIELVEVYEELDVSGGWPLARRSGLLPAIEAIERGTADVLAVAFFDRLVRSLVVQAEILERVEAASGSVVAIDVGEVSTATAASWMSATMLGVMSEYVRRKAREATNEAKADAVARGVPPIPHVPFGYRRAADGRLEVVPEEAELVRRAFEMRAAGQAIQGVYDYLRAHGFTHSFHSVQRLLVTRLVLGEIHFGKLVNLAAHEPIVDRGLWQRVQKVSVPRGRRSVSDRLLARQGILRCGSCGSKLSVGHLAQARGKYWLYRCVVPGRACPAPVHIAATLAEERVIAEVERLAADEYGSASVERNIAAAAADAERAQALLDAAIEAFDGIDAQSAKLKIQALQKAATEADERLERLRAVAGPARVITATSLRDDRVTLDERRTFIRTALRDIDVRVMPGRGRDRIKFLPK